MGRKSVNGAVVFDLDNTLYDSTTAKERGMVKAFGEVLPPAAAAVAVAQFKRAEPALFEQMVGGEIGLEEYRLSRFRVEALCGVLAHDDDHRLLYHLNATFMGEANGNVRLTRSATSLLKNLRQDGIATAVLTNGPTDGQQMKISVLGLDELVDTVHISGTCGLAKPDPEAFWCVLSELRVPVGRGVMIGDDVVNDIQGAGSAGMAALQVKGHGDALDDSLRAAVQKARGWLATSRSEGTSPA